MLKEKSNKREVQAKETHIKIVHAAVRLFARHGYHKTTITDLAQAIGLTTGAIFHHFSTKEAILNAVVDWLERGMHRYSEIMVNTQRGSQTLVEEVVRLMCDHFKRNPEATICLAALATEFGGSNHPIEMRLKQIYEVFVEPFALKLQDHESVTDPRAASIAFVGSVQGIAVQGLLRYGEQSIDALAEGFLSMMKKW
ncbi:MAG TPA: TetR/AcrR family transcriptional regulator [Syntrophobacteraceae bacterium]|nr:TetR/AcrR family transcriptional regulator [Syntrophobacteraceae bacterium]